jgi:predicted TPR repeat methyltransferase
MKSGQISFAIAGVIFGFLVGFAVAHQMYVGRGDPFDHLAVPAGMSGAGAPGTASGGAGGQPGGGPDAPSMDTVTREIAALKEMLEQEPDNFVALTRLGNLFFDAGMFDGAVGYYERALQVTPDDINVRTDLGTSLRRLGRPQEAMKHFEEAVSRDPGHWKGWFNIGVVALYDLGQFDRAEEAFTKVDQLNPGAIDMTALREEIERVRSGDTGG